MGTYRKHGALPSYFQFRDGRPAWIPSQGLRGSGWSRRDLKGPDGAWLSMGAAIDQAALINDGVALWRQGLSVPPALADIAPAGACEAAPGVRRPEDRLSIGALMDAWAGVKAPFKGGEKVRWTTPPSDAFAELRPSTQKDYANKAKRLLDTLAGWPEGLAPNADAATAQAYAQDIADLRAESVFTLEAGEDVNGINDPLREVYRLLVRHAGLNMANGVLTVAGVWLGWCRRHQTRRIQNWAGEVDRKSSPGRIRVLSWAELRALTTTAEGLGWASIADAVILGIDLSWSQADRLDLTWNRVTPGDDGRLRALTRSQLTDGPSARRVGRAKTGRIGGTPFLSLGLDRIKIIQARQQAMAAQPTHVLWCETTGAPWKADHFRHVFAEIRAKAAETLPSVADATDQDLRDTAITFFRRAGLDIDQACSRSLQSRRRVLDLWDQAYGEIGPEIADAGADRMNVWLAGQKGAL